MVRLPSVRLTRSERPLINRVRELTSPPIAFGFHLIIFAVAGGWKSYVFMPEIGWTKRCGSSYLLTLADDVIEYPFRNAAIDRGEVTSWVKKQSRPKSAARRLSTQKQT